MSDIAERLKKLIEKHEYTYSSRGLEVIATDMAFLLTNYRKEIISALQFAEDMQRLADAGYSPMIYPSLGEYRLTTFKSGEGPLTVYQASDIFTAARNAVEKMEGK